VQRSGDGDAKSKLTLMPFMPLKFYLFLLCPYSSTRLHVVCNMSSLQSKLMKFGSLDDMTLHYSSDFDEITRSF
jgi:hypothetical protein